MMKKAIVLLLILFFNSLESVACLNYYYAVDNKGHLHVADDLQRGFNTNFNFKLIETKLLKLEKQLKINQDYGLLSDYAVLLLKAGKTKVALDILAQLSKHYPNEYQIVANLGTAYELNGDVEKAIQFIKQGIMLNPNSHGGSEWVHLKVLEAKLKLTMDSLYLSKNSVLDLTENDKNDPLVRKQILIQIRERFPFSPGPNQIMASMLVDLGDCFVNTVSIEFAKVLYTIAKLYYGGQADLIDRKIDEMVVLRRRFSNVKPEKRHDVGDNVRLSGIRYKKMLDNNNPYNYQIEWDDILINADTLLMFANLKRVADVDNASEVLLTDTVTNDSIPDISLDEAGDSDRFNYMALLAVFILLLGYWLYKKRSASKAE